MGMYFEVLLTVFLLKAGNLLHTVLLGKADLFHKLMPFFVFFIDHKCIDVVFINL